MALVRSVSQAFSHVYCSAPVAVEWMGRRVSYPALAGVITLLLVSVIGLIYNRVTYRNRITDLTAQAGVLTQNYKSGLQETDEQRYQTLLEQLPPELGSLKRELISAHDHFSNVRKFLQGHAFEENSSLLNDANFDRVTKEFDTILLGLQQDPDMSSLGHLISQIEERKQAFLTARGALVHSLKRDKIVGEARVFIEQNDFLQNLALIKDESGQRIEYQFNEFSTALAPYRNDSTHEKWIAQFEQLKLTFLQMRAHRRELFHIPISINPNGTISTVDNGNCFYESVARSLDLSRSDSPLERSVYSAVPSDLRSTVVQWMRDNLATDALLRDKIQNSIWTILIDVDEQITQELESIKALEREGHSQTDARRQLEEKKKSFAPIGGRMPSRII
jgi:hypothetical protein